MALLIPTVSPTSIADFCFDSHFINYHVTGSAGGNAKDLDITGNRACSITNNYQVVADNNQHFILDEFADNAINGGGRAEYNLTGS